ncbi:MAG: ATP-binding protein [Thermodesulfobacteriota bacterium]|nr:ATP-binding protein [Thermodesulfobacteriota bacterium]
MTERTIEQMLFKDKYDYKKTLSELSKAMISILDKENLLKTIINTITEAMGVEKASILLIDEEKGFYSLQSGREFIHIKEQDFRLALDDPFIIWFNKQKEIVIKEELERDIDNEENRVIVEKLGVMASELCIPLFTKQKLIGLCNLGNKQKGDMFSHEDLALLETLSNQAAIAIENAILYEDLKKSEAYIRRTERLAALGTLTAGLAHEIRNPMVAIKTFVQLIPDRLDDADFMENFLKITSDEVERICVLVNELLEFSRPSEPKFQKEYINDIIEKMILLVENKAKKKKIRIIKRYGKGLPLIFIDQEKIKQVLLNLLMNSIDAIKADGLISVTTRLIRKRNSKSYIQIEIGDNGEGINKDDLDHIFIPFFTRKYKGSGLGLSISYSIIQEHSGFIEVESKIGGGTIFYIDLPLGLDEGSVFHGINRSLVNMSEG